VRGVCLSQTYPTCLLGNDRPLTVVTEYWFRKLELARQEPDALLFGIPDDYKLLKETVQQSISAASGEPGDGRSTGSSNSSGSLPAGVARAGVGGVTHDACVVRTLLIARKHGRKGARISHTQRDRHGYGPNREGCVLKRSRPWRQSKTGDSHRRQVLTANG
jgi:hypothetical protein